MTFLKLNTLFAATSFLALAAQAQSPAPPQTAEQQKTETGPVEPAASATSSRAEAYFH
jgi:hypothetical protein